MIRIVYVPLTLQAHFAPSQTYHLRNLILVRLILGKRVSRNFRICSSVIYPLYLLDWLKISTAGLSYLILYTVYKWMYLQYSCISFNASPSLFQNTFSDLSTAWSLSSYGTKILHGFEKTLSTDPQRSGWASTTKLFYVISGLLVFGLCCAGVTLAIKLHRGCMLRMPSYLFSVLCLHLTFSPLPYSGHNIVKKRLKIWTQLKSQFELQAIPPSPVLQPSL